MMRDDEARHDDGRGHLQPPDQSGDRDRLT